MSASSRSVMPSKPALLVGILFIFVFGLLWATRSAFLEDSRLPVVFSNAGVSKGEFLLEIASTEQERRKGLMYRKEMSPEHGMLFIFPDEKPRSFWMKDTYLSLDIIFINSDRKVVGIHHSVPILNEEPRAISTPSQYVIELVAGTAKAKGITEGDEVQFLRQLPKGI